MTKYLEMKGEKDMSNLCQWSFEGYFANYIFHNEKTGEGIFKICTSHSFLMGDAVADRIVVKRDARTKKYITWRYIICDATKCPTPFFSKGTPLIIYGGFTREKERWIFKLNDVRMESHDEMTLSNYFNSGNFPELSYQQSMALITYLRDTKQLNIIQFAEQENAAAILKEVCGVNKETAKNIIAVIMKTKMEEKVFRILSKANISFPYAAKCVKYYGNEAFKQLINDPYKTGYRIGLHLDECDKIMRHLGKYAPLDASRLKFAAFETTRRIENNGHTWTSLNDFAKAVNRTIIRTGDDSNNIELTSVLSVFYQTRELFCKSNKKNSIVYNRKIYDAENNAVENIIRLTSNREKIPFDARLIRKSEKACGMSYGKQQREAFPKILESKGIKILTGGPGTGKTTTIKGIILAYQEMHPKDVVKLCAPTGRAAQRMAESTEMPACTVHRLLNYTPYGEDANFKDASDPIDADLIVVDEVSMLDISLFSMLIDAIKTGATLVLVGDIHQLESVGPGAVLHDLLDINDKFIPKCMLTDVFRQKGGSPIIDNSKRINEGRTSLVTGKDFQIIQTKTETESMEKVKGIMKKYYDPKDPFKIQILCPSREGISGVVNQNTILQECLNTSKDKIFYGKGCYKVNDKIIMTKNNYEADYYNGDIGIIRSIDKNKQLHVEIREKEYVLTRDMMEDIRLAYGMTIHKSQGSEFPIVIVVMPMKPKIMLVRNLLYTAITRAKKQCIIINEGTALETAIKTIQAGNRRTRLKTLLEQRGMC